MIIGQSKEIGLLEKVSNQDSKFRNLKYEDVGQGTIWTDKPLVQGYSAFTDGGIDIVRTEGVPKLSEGNTGTNMAETRLKIPIQARFDDTLRITKLLTTAPGITWLAHQTELETIQKNLVAKRLNPATSTMDASTNMDPSFWNKVKGALKTAGAALVDSATLTASTLAQVAAAGTGYHATPYNGRSYIDGKLKPSLLDDLLNSFSTSDSAGTLTLNGASVTIRPDYTLIQGDAGNEVAGYNVADLTDLSKFTHERFIHEYSEVKGQYSRVSGSKYNKLGKKYLGDVKSSQYFTMLPEDQDKDSDASVLRTRLEQTSQVSSSVVRYPEYDNGYMDSNGLGFVSSGSLTTNTYTDKKSYANSSTATPFTRLQDSSQDKDDDGSALVKQLELKGKTSGSINYPESNGGYVDSNNLGFVSTGSLRENTYTESNTYAKSSMYLGSRGASLTDISGSWKSTDILESKAYTRADSTGIKKEEMVEGSNVDFSGSRIEMIPFWIQALSPEFQDNCVLYFEANLSSYSDSYTGDWQNTQYVGRADKFYTYTGFDRQIDFSFKAVAKNRQALRPIYNRINGLVGMTAPTYGQEGTFMHGVLAKIRIGDLLIDEKNGSNGMGQTGFIKSVKLNWQVDYPWETQTEYLIVPHVLDVSVSFTPIHTVIPQDRKRYYGLVDGTNSNSGVVPTFIGGQKKVYPSKENN